MPNLWLQTYCSHCGEDIYVDLCSPSNGYTPDCNQFQCPICGGYSRMDEDGDTYKADNRHSDYDALEQPYPQIPHPQTLLRLAERYAIIKDDLGLTSVNVLFNPLVSEWSVMVTWQDSSSTIVINNESLYKAINDTQKRLNELINE